MSAHYVYRCYSEDGRLLYVGQSKNPPARMTQHRSRAFWASMVTAVKVKVYKSPEIARIIERRAIREENPRFNKQGRWAVRATWDREAHTDYVTTVLEGQSPLTANHGWRPELEAVFDHYFLRFGEEHPDAQVILAGIATRDAQREEKWARQREETTRQREEWDAREAASDLAHRENCCACRVGIVIEDGQIVEQP